MNIPKDQEPQEELAKKAALLIHELKTRKINRFKVEQEIARLPEEQREEFKILLNKYRKVA